MSTASIPISLLLTFGNKNTEKFYKLKLKQITKQFEPFWAKTLVKKKIVEILYKVKKVPEV